MDSGRGDNLLLAFFSVLTFWKSVAKVLLLFLFPSHLSQMKGMNMH